MIKTWWFDLGARKFSHRKGVSEGPPPCPRLYSKVRGDLGPLGQVFRQV